MLFRTISKQDFRTLVDKLLEFNEVVGPKVVGRNANGEPMHQFLPVQSYDELDFKYKTTELSAKTYFLPFRETLSTFDLTGDDWNQEIRYRIQPRAIIGLHACDINALLKLDHVFNKDFFPSPYYISRRRNTVVIGIDHEPCEGGFCKSLGTDTVSHGFDLFLTEIGERYFVTIGSDRGYTILQQVDIKPITDDDTKNYLDTRKRIAGMFTTRVNVQNLPNLLDIEFESSVWDKWGQKCLSCGNCAMVCPTCYCYGVNEHVSMDFKQATKHKQLYSCNLVDFAQVAGGHNFRPDRKTRLKYRYYHQHRGFVEAYDMPKCVGCNRCGRTCLAGINPPDIISELQAEDRK